MSATSKAEILTNKISKLQHTLSKIAQWRNSDKVAIEIGPVSSRYNGRVKQPLEFRGLSWTEVNKLKYNPQEYTDPNILNGTKAGADTNLNDWKERGAFYKKFSPHLVGESEIPNKTPMASETGRPINPMGATGITGRGALYKWGANHAADPVVLSLNNNGSLDLLVIKRKDEKHEDQFAFPGGMIEEGEKGLQAAARETMEETGANIKEVVQNGLFLGAGYNGDGRNTDNAWVETSAYLFVVNNKQPVKGGDDARDAMWIKVNQNNLENHMKFAGQGKMFAICVEKIGKQLAAHILERDILTGLQIKNIELQKETIQDPEKEISFTIKPSGSTHELRGQILHLLPKARMKLDSQKNIHLATGLRSLEELHKLVLKSVNIGKHLNRPIFVGLRKSTNPYKAKKAKPTEQKGKQVSARALKHTRGMEKEANPAVKKHIDANGIASKPNTQKATRNSGTGTISRGQTATTKHIERMNAAGEERARTR